MDSQTFVIPVDFTEVTLNAIRFGVKLSEKDNDHVILLHIVKSEGDVNQAELKLQKIIDDLTTVNRENISFKVIEGKVESDIGKISEVADASLIIMGTHGEKGVERFFGSKALKTITQSKVPFIVLQKDTEYENIEKIAMTIDLEKESVQIVKAAVSISKKFNSEVILIGGAHTDPMLKQKVTLNMRVTLSHLQENGIKGSVELLERKNFEDNLITYCRDNQIDMIAATYYPDTFHMLSEKFVQHLLENELDIPVLTVDAMAVTKGSQYSFMSV